MWEIYLYSGALRGTIINSVVDSCYQSMIHSKVKYLLNQNTVCLFGHYPLSDFQVYGGKAWWII